MKRFMLFQGSEYYPSGGMSDFIGSYYTLEAALNQVEQTIKNDTYESLTDFWRYRWAHIYDIETNEKIWEK